MNTHLSSPLIISVTPVPTEMIITASGLELKLTIVEPRSELFLVIGNLPTDAIQILEVFFKRGQKSKPKESS